MYVLKMREKKTTLQLLLDTPYPTIPRLVRVVFDLLRHDFGKFQKLYRKLPHLRRYLRLFPLLELPPKQRYWVMYNSGGGFYDRQLIVTDTFGLPFFGGGITGITRSDAMRMCENDGEFECWVAYWTARGNPDEIVRFVEMADGLLTRKHAKFLVKYGHLSLEKSLEFFPFLFARKSSDDG